MFLSLIIPLSVQVNQYIFLHPPAQKPKCASFSKRKPLSCWDSEGRVPWHSLHSVFWHLKNPPLSRTVGDQSRGKSVLAFVWGILPANWAARNLLFLTPGEAHVTRAGFVLSERLWGAPTSSRLCPSPRIPAVLGFPNTLLVHDGYLSRLLFQISSPC